MGFILLVLIMVTKDNSEILKDQGFFLYEVGLKLIEVCLPAFAS